MQDLLNASVGPNLGIDFLPGSFGVDGQVSAADDEGARVLWLDAFTANVDRSWRNPNLLLWHGDLWVIDHGASLYFHHGWRSGVTDPAKFAAQPWDVGGHVFETCARRARELDDGDRRTRSTATSSSRSWPRCPTSGSSRCPARRRPTRCGRRTSTSSPPASAPASGSREVSR